MFVYFVLQLSCALAETVESTKAEVPATKRRVLTVDDAAALQPVVPTTPPVPTVVAPPATPPMVATPAVAAPVQNTVSVPALKVAAVGLSYEALLAESKVIESKLKDAEFRIGRATTLAKSKAAEVAKKASAYRKNSGDAMVAAGFALLVEGQAQANIELSQALSDKAGLIAQSAQLSMAFSKSLKE
jgi:hypothetical protein